ncbi:MAG TPA: histidine kinase dimerization/phospho-acceptor domain-containing protein [Alphaproteobacteria bacterium]|nr:histidine kinase dimerization/phospho-acceptor domain-containing protein [Alphaproteobacteria bacterium]
MPFASILRSRLPGRPGVRQAGASAVGLLMGLAAVGLLLLGAVTHRQAREQTEARRAIEAGLATQAQLAGLLSDVKSIETGTLAYLLTGQQTHLPPYHEGLARLGGRLRHVGAALRGREEEVIPLRRVGRHTWAAVEDLIATVEALTRGDRQSAQAIAESGIAQAQIEALRIAVREIDERVRRDVAIRADRLQARTAVFEVLIGLVLACTLLCLALHVRNMRRHLRERDRASRALADAVAAAEASSRAKSDFLSGMSHELRTPLNAILGFAETMEMGVFGPLQPRYREYAGLIMASGRHLTALIDDLLDLSKIEAGRMTLNEAVIDAGALLREMAGLFEAEARRRCIRFEIEPPPEAAALLADPRMMRQILINLIGNALRFTGADGRVVLSYREPGPGPIFTVSDSGRGMDPGDVAVAMEPFRQIHAAVDAARGFDRGTGLGLPLTSRLAQLHGGRLVITSAVGVGTTVEVCLPPWRRLPPGRGQGSVARASEPALS